MKPIEHKDFFGNLIEVGDEIIRPKHSVLHKEIVCKITPSSIYIENDRYGKKPDGTYGKFPHPLRLNEWYIPNLINLTKLNN